MASIKEELKSNINNPRLISPIFNLPSNVVNYGEMTNGQILDAFHTAKDVLNTAIDDGSYEDLPYVKRLELRDSVRKAANHTSIEIRLENIDKFINSVRTSGLNSDKDILTRNLLEYLGDENSNTVQHIRQKLYRLDTELQNFEKLKSRLSDTEKELPARIKEIEIFLDEFAHQKAHVFELFESILRYERESEHLLMSVKESEKDIESKKLSISTFATNIDEYKDRIESIEDKAKKVVNQDGKIKSLIEQAEIALQLTSAQGISGAFATQYKNATKGWILYGWPVASFVFVVAAICLTVALITETKIKDPKLEINPILIAYPWIIIVGRAVSVSICLSVAAFCARQYTKQKNIAEDYAYKSVLAKSIVAFTKEIRKVDEEKATEYLATVLAEIHQDPLRMKLTKADSLSTIDFNAIADRVSAVLSRQKSEE